MHIPQAGFSRLIGSESISPEEIIVSRLTGNYSTPLGDSHIGTLMFCLPSPFAGGELVVRHEGHTTTFDWGKSAQDTIAWGFLYSDCEHEVLPVISGTRITLSYDIYVADTKSSISGIDTTLQSFREGFSTLKNLLAGRSEFRGKLAFSMRHT